MTQNQKELVIIDPFVSGNVPALKSLVFLIPVLREKGWRVSTWALTVDNSLTFDSVRRVPHAWVPSPLKPAWFFVCANVIAARIVKSGQKSPQSVWHTSSFSCLRCDLFSVQFVSDIWFKKLWNLGLTSFWELGQWLICGLGAVIEAIVYRCSKPELVAPASDSIEAEVKKRFKSTTKFRVMPNAYDPIRFSPEARSKHRPDAREELGFSPGTIAFSFLSQGHFRRKGFWLAVSALATVRQRQPHWDIKFLVIGGKSQTLERLKQVLRTKYPGWESWIIFAGAPAHYDRYLAATDFFLFPSYFEAFSLAVIEAAGLGVPLLLTPHHGSEMILADGINGKFVSYDPAVMAEQIEALLPPGGGPFSWSIGRALEVSDYLNSFENVYEDILKARPR